MGHGPEVHVPLVPFNEPGRQDELQPVLELESEDVRLSGFELKDEKAGVVGPYVGRVLPRRAGRSWRYE